MFSKNEKQVIAAMVEKILLDLGHPEMPKDKVRFTLHVDGAAPWLWADISPNWTFDEKNPPTVNGWNEKARGVMEPHSPDCCEGGPPSPMVESTPENACCDLEAERMRARGGKS